MDLRWRRRKIARYPAEYFPGEEILAADVAEPLLPVRDEDGIRRIHLGTSPGIGVEPDEEVLEKYCVERVKDWSLG